MPDHYADLRIRVRAWEASCYPVEAELDDGSRFEGGELRLDQQALLASELDSKAYGQLLFNALFAGDIRRAYDKATARADALTEGRLRVQLWVDDEAVELHAIPWERLYHLSRGHPVPLTTSTQTPFSRYTSLETPEPPPVAERPIKVLAAISSPLNLPGGLAPANIEVEIDNLRRGLGDLRKKNAVQVTILPGRSGLSPELRGQLEAEGYQIAEGNTSLDNLVRYLPGMHVFHFVGHGAFRRQSEHGPGQAVLYLEKDDGAWQVAKDDDVVARLAALGDLPHLIFLVACESAVREAKAEHPFIGLGPKLVQAGFPAVVAMQAQVPVESARILTGEFYRRLFEHGEVDQALSQARLLMFKPDRTDWAIPVLFMRLKTGELFAVKAKEAKMPEEKSGQSGGVNISGGNVTVGGDLVGRDKITTTTYGPGVSPDKLVELLKEFASIKRRIGTLDLEDEDKDDLKTNVQRVEDEVKKGEQADTSRVEKALKKIAGMSDDILKVVVASLTNPAAGVAETIRLIAQKAKESK
jgi:CHAT domain-containing protein